MVAEAGGNFPPVADAVAMPEEALVGEVINFSSDGSFDPDLGPMPLTFDWDFGDGTQSTDANPTHSYDAEGLYVVTLIVDDGLATSLVNLAVVALEPPARTPPRHSAPLALSPDDASLAVVNPDSNSLSVVDTGTLMVEEFAVGIEPRSVASVRAGRSAPSSPSATSTGSRCSTRMSGATPSAWIAPVETPATMSSRTPRFTTSSWTTPT